MFDYPVMLTPDEGTLLVTFPDVPEAITFGMTVDEAMLHAVDALETGLSFYVDARKALPEPSVRPDLLTVRSSVLEGVKLAIYREICCCDN